MRQDFVATVAAGSARIAHPVDVTGFARKIVVGGATFFGKREGHTLKRLIFLEGDVALKYESSVLKGYSEFLETKSGVVDNHYA